MSGNVGQVEMIVRMTVENTIGQEDGRDHIPTSSQEEEQAASRVTARADWTGKTWDHPGNLAPSPRCTMVLQVRWIKCHERTPAAAGRQAEDDWRELLGCQRVWRMSLLYHWVHVE